MQSALKQLFMRNLLLIIASSTMVFFTVPRANATIDVSLQMQLGNQPAQLPTRTITIII